MHRIRFGTDGWRAVIAERFTFDAVERLAQATAEYWRSTQPNKRARHVVIGYDTRFFSDRFAAAAVSVFAGNGFEVSLSRGPVSTPAVSYAVKRKGAAGGVMITASHNPPIFSGFKLKSDYGGSADTPTLRAVEAQLDQVPVHRMPLPAALEREQVRYADLDGAHLAAVRQLVDFQAIARSRLQVAHDALFGVGAGCFERLLRGTTCRVTTLNAAPDPLFGGICPEPVITNYRQTSSWLRRHPQDICLVTDGDADRIGGMDGRGGHLTTHQLISLTLAHLVKHRGQRGRVVKALTTTSMVEKICDKHSLPLTQTGVGFKFICAEMAKGDVLVGVEESGGIGFPQHIPERDGVAAGMMLLELLSQSAKPVGKLIAELEKEFGPHRYGRVDLHLPMEHRERLMAWLPDHPPSRLSGSSVEAMLTFDGVKMIAKDGSWLMLRGSGTEPVLRVYAESSSDARVRSLLALGKHLVSQGVPR